MHYTYARGPRDATLEALFVFLIVTQWGCEIMTISPITPLVLAFAGAPLFAQMTIALTPSVASPAPLGTAITWNATASGASDGTLSYRFRTRAADGAFRTVVDYGPNGALTWGTIDHEGPYEIEASVKNNATGEVATTSAQFNYTPLATGNTPVITPTANALVFIYSAPPCAAGSKMRVFFQAGNGAVQSTPYKQCDPNYTTNFYIAGLRPQTDHTVWDSVQTGRTPVDPPMLTFTTPPIQVAGVTTTLLTPNNGPENQGVLLQSLFGMSSIATDLAGNVIWYSPSDISFLTRPQAGGTFLGIGEDDTKGPSAQFVREFDLAGITRAETNAARVNEQLAAMGVHAINGFHHEARKLENGSYLVLADSERMLTDVQGSGTVDVIGDTILVLDANLQVTWAWDAFDHLDPHRAALLGETCAPGSGLACPPWYLSPTANDWLHGNALQLTPDGNILYSIRHQDWLVKIDYENGAGTGNILWKLGKDGDFQIVSSDPDPWFSHQHDANIELSVIGRQARASAGQSMLTVFDDGNTRAATNPAADSRGQVLQLDEQNRTATLVLNADLGTYSAAVGSAQHLQNGNYHFDSGFINDPSAIGGRSSQSLEVTPAGQIVYSIQFGLMEYRSFRMTDLYTP